MNPPRCQSEDYIDSLVATPKLCSATEAARVQPEQPRQPAHDAFTRLLHRLEPDPATLWAESKPHVDLNDGVLVLDDSTLDKPYASKIELVGRHWSGKRHPVVAGISLVSLLWTDGDRHIPCDYRIYHKPTDGLTKNEHAQAMLQAAADRGFKPKCVLFDGWYSSLENLKKIRGLIWNWLTHLKSNRKVRVDRGEEPGTHGDRGQWHGGAVGWVRSDPGIQDRRPRRRRCVLGDERPDPDGTDTAAVRRVQLSDRERSQGTQAVYGG